MIEYFISAEINASFDKFISPQELDCRRNYAIVCRAEEKEHPWDYAGTTRVGYIGLSGTGMAINSTSSTAHISMPLFGSFA